MLLAEEVHARGYKVTLTGEGADEWLAGYPWYKVDRLLGCLDFIPGLPLIRVLLVMQVINGLLLPIILFAILKLVNDRELMGASVNGLLYNIGAWLTAVVVTLLSLLFILSTLFPKLMRF